VSKELNLLSHLKFNISSSLNIVVKAFGEKANELQETESWG